MWTRPVRRRRITWSALACYAVVTSGLPLPMGVVAPTGPVDSTATALLAAKDRSRPFPCRDKPCGCVSADQCFTKCCCNTPAETLAWARAHSVEPAVLAALERRVASAAPVAASCCASAKAPAESSRCTTVTSPAKPSCCAPVTPPACCASAEVDSDSHPADTADADVCRDYQPLAGHDHHDTMATGTTQPADTPPQRAIAADDAATPPDDTPLSCRTLVLRSMLACGGIVAEWFSICAAPPPPPVAPVDRTTPPGTTLVLTDERIEPRAVVPDVPPPRAA
jgi:hypothetical protein